MDFSAALVLKYNIQSPLNYSFMFLLFLKPLTVLLCLSACPGESANSSGTTVKHTCMHTCARAHRHTCRHARRDTALDSSAWQRLVTHETPSESGDSELPRWGASQLVILSCALPGEEGEERGLWRSRSVQSNRAPIALSLIAEQECNVSCGGHSEYGLWGSSAMHSLDSSPLTIAEVPFCNCP